MVKNVICWTLAGGLFAIGIFFFIRAIILFI